MQSMDNKCNRCKYISVCTQTISSKYRYNNDCNAKYKELRVERERFKRKHQDMFRGLSAALRLRLHTEEFQLSTKDFSQRDLHREITTITNQSTQFQLSHLYTRGKAQSQAKRKEKITTW